MDSSHLRTIHGVLVRVSGVGVLLIGDSGTGKTRCALELIAAGHQLVADDVVELRIIDGKLTGNPPVCFQGIANIRSRGLVDLRLEFGQDVVAGNAPIDIVIRMTNASCEKQKRRFRDLFGFSVLLYDYQPETDGELTTFVETLAASQALIRS